MSSRCLGIEHYSRSDTARTTWPQEREAMYCEAFPPLERDPVSVFRAHGCAQGGMLPRQHSMPVIIAGLPGSSTRGFAKMLKTAGVFIGHMEWGRGAALKERTPCPHTATEARALNHSFNPEFDFVQGREPDMSRKLLTKFEGNVEFSLGALSGGELGWEVQTVSCRAYQHLIDLMHRCTREAIDRVTRNGKVSCMHAARVVPLAHGWKHSSAMLMLPVYNAMFGSRFYFVHIVRDGRDLALSINRATAKRFRHFCGDLASPPRVGACSSVKQSIGGAGETNNPKLQLYVWAIANLAVTRLARRMLGPRYVLTRAEDVMSPSAEVRRSAITSLLAALHLQQTGTPYARLEEVFQHRLGWANLRNSAIAGGNKSEGRGAVYSGKWRLRVGPECMAEMLALPLVCEALKEYGYLASDDCVSRPR